MMLLMERSHEDNIKTLFRRWQNDPVAFVRECIGVEKIDPQQILILTELRKIVRAKEIVWAVANGQMDEAKLTDEVKFYSKKLGISIDSGRGVGKTTTMSWAATWFLLCFNQSRIISTAPKRDLLKDNLWGELSKWRRKSIDKYSQQGSFLSHLEIQSDKIYLKYDPSKGKDWYILARTISKGAGREEQKTTISGYHADYFMVIADESYGIPDVVYEPIEASFTGAVNFMLLIGNPIKNYGYARETWTKMKDYWVNVRLNAEDSTLVSPDHLERLRLQYRDEPNKYRIDVLGLPPEDEPDALIPYSKIMQAVERETLLNKG